MRKKIPNSCVAMYLLDALTDLELADREAAERGEALLVKRLRENAPFEPNPEHARRFAKLAANVPEVLADLARLLKVG